MDTGGCGLVALRGLTEEDVPGTEMERKSIWGRPKKYREVGLEFCIILDNRLHIFAIVELDHVAVVAEEKSSSL